MRSEESNVHIVMLSHVVHLIVPFFIPEFVFQTVSFTIALIKGVWLRGGCMKRVGLEVICV